MLETPFSRKIYDRLATTNEIDLFLVVLDYIDSLYDDWSYYLTIISPFGSVLNQLNNYPNPDAIQQQVIDTVNEFTDLITAQINEIHLISTSVDFTNILAFTICTLSLRIRDLLDQLIPDINSLADYLSCKGFLFNPDITDDAFSDAISDLLFLLFDIDDALSNIEALLLLFNEYSPSYILSLRNAEGTCLTGRQLLVEGILNEKILYTSDSNNQSICSISATIPIYMYVMVYPKFTGLDSNNFVQNFPIDIINNDGDVETIDITGLGFSCTDTEFDRYNITVNTCEDFHIKICVEDVVAFALDRNSIFNSISLFISAKPIDGDICI